jgi:hypothetical protein
MPLKVEIKREVPRFESLSSKDQQRFEIFISRLYDNLEELSRRALEAGTLAEQVQAEQKSLINNLATPSITHNQDSVLSSVGNLSADLLAEVVGVIANHGYITVKDNAGNSIRIMTA